MKIKKSTGIIVSLVAITVLIAVCNNEPKQTTDPNGTAIVPVQLPVIVPGFNFPEDSNTIYSWMNNASFAYNYDSASVYKHAWGIWAGLTAKTKQVYAGDTLLTYETWLGVTEIQDLIVNGSKNCEGATKPLRAFLSEPHQFGHGLPIADKARMLNSTSDTVNKHPKFWVTVSYDPNASCYALNNQILKLSVLNTYAKTNAIGRIPAFPARAITVKPSYYVGQQTDGLIRIPVWTGPPPTLRAYGPDAWPYCVYADVNNQQPANKKPIPAHDTAKSTAAIAAATVNLNDFIHFTVDQQMANHMNKSDSSEGLSGRHRAKAGEIAVLICMHVATKEISNWTWQTYYWAPDPASPQLPSSNLAASLRPSQLQGAASHYALATAYAMVLPNQPITGGTNNGVQPMLTYNPYLEAGFHGTFPEPHADFQLRSVLLPGPQYGIQTNCMSCHALATVSNTPGYTTDQYIGLDNQLFINNILLDFAWSIEGNMIIDTGGANIKKGR